MTVRQITKILNLPAVQKSDVVDSCYINFYFFTISIIWWSLCRFIFILLYKSICFKTSNYNYVTIYNYKNCNDILFTISNSSSFSEYSTFSSSSLKSGAKALQLSTKLCDQMEISPLAIEAMIALRGCQAISSIVSPLVPFNILTNVPSLVLQIERACCLAEPIHYH